MDLANVLQSLTHDNFELTLSVPGLYGAGSQRPAAVRLILNRHAGVWQPAFAAVAYAAADAVSDVDCSALTVEGRRLHGPVKMVLNTTEAKTKKRTSVPVVVELDLSMAEPTDAPEDNGEQTHEGRFWMVQPQSQGIERLVSGTYSAIVNGQPLSGSAHGRMVLPVRPGYFNVGSKQETSPPAINFSFDMGTTRRNWNHVRLAVHQFAEPRDLRGYQAVRVRLSTTMPRPDVSVSVWLREADGSWYYYKSAVPLVSHNNEAVLLLDGFCEAEWVAPGSHLDEDYVFDRSAVSHLALGVVNALGVGVVPVRLESIEWLQLETTAAVSADVVVTGRTLAVNGHAVVPPGLFGGYAPDLPQVYRPGTQRALTTPVTMIPPRPGETEAFRIDCWFDRFTPAVLLTRRDWQEALTQWGRTYGEKAAAANYVAHLEFWNEPYLNWARHPARNYNLNFYNVDEAVEGGPVKVRYKTPKPGESKTKPTQFDYFDGPVIPHFTWRRKADGEWSVADTTQYSYWSGRGNGWIYDQMAVALGKSLKETNPKAQYVVGWGFRWHEDHWAPWDVLYKPTIDATIQYIDGVHEHHYQGDTTAMVGSYEVLVAYAKTRHNKWLYCYNTETNDLVDAPARGIVDTPEKAKAASQYRRMTYNLRDILYCIAEAPDKARSRTVIHHTQSPDATAIAFGLMSNLRGRLIATSSSDPDIWCVSSVDGTDPAAMAPGAATTTAPATQPAPLTFVTFLFNDHREPRAINLALQVPQGMTAEAGLLETTTVAPDTFAIGVERKEIPAPTVGYARLAITLPPRTACKISYPMSGTLVKHHQIERRQFFSPTILQSIALQSPVKFDITLDETTRRQARRAYLRLVTEDIALGEGDAIVNGQEIVPLPAAPTGDNNNRIVMLPIDLANLRAQNTVTFLVNGGNFAGYRVNMASIVLESARKD